MPHRKAKTELYDLQSDPSESVDLHDKNPDVVDELRSVITQIVARGRTTLGPAQPNDTGYWDDLTWMTEAEYDQFHEGEKNE